MLLLVLPLLTRVKKFRINAQVCLLTTITLTQKLCNSFKKNLHNKDFNFLVLLHCKRSVRETISNFNLSVRWSNFPCLVLSPMPYCIGKISERVPFACQDKRTKHKTYKAKACKVCFFGDLFIYFNLFLSSEPLNSG